MILNKAEASDFKPEIICKGMLLVLRLYASQTGKAERNFS